MVETAAIERGRCAVEPCSAAMTADARTRRWRTRVWMNGVKDKIWFLREGLFAKYVIALVGLVVFVLAVNGALETWISYRGIKSTLTDAMSEKAEATERRIEQSMADRERQISWVTRASSTKIEDRRADYQQLLNQVPWVSQLSQISGKGRETLRLSRQGISYGSTLDFSHDATFIETRSRGTSFAPAYFRDDQPFMSIAVAHSDANLGITVAEIALPFLSSSLLSPHFANTTSAYSS